MFFSNIAPMHRSTVNSIQLLAIVKSKHIKKYSMNKVLAPIVADIAKLVSYKVYLILQLIIMNCVFFVIQEDGYCFQINGRVEKHYGTLVATNLGQCSIGGFKEGSTAYRGCRHCMAKRKCMQTKVHKFLNNSISV